MRKLVLALAVGLLVAASATTAAPQKADAAAVITTKVVLVVGATQSVTASYRSEMDAAATVFLSHNSASHPVTVTKVYSPNATWGAVSAAALGANILVYMGHGSGFPNPYLSYLQPNGDNGMGLNASAAGTDSNTAYYGENYMATLGLAANAVVILNHLCYASGDNEWGTGLPSLATAKTRVDGYASGFIRGGAKAVIADGVSGISSYINALFTGHTTIDALWKSMPNFHNNVTSWASTRSAGYTSEIDPDLQHPQSDGDYYYRSMVSIPTLKTDDVLTGQIPAYVSQSGTYYPIEPVRVVDTRGNGIGPAGALNTRTRYTFKMVGAAVPSNAIAVTANLTVTNQTSPGWVYVGPTIWGTPASSTINFPVNDNRANGVTVALSPQGTIDAWYYGISTSSTIDVIIDVTGYYVAGKAGSGFIPYGPRRFVDTRIGLGLSSKLQSGQPRKIMIATMHGLPATGITAIVGNVTAVYPSILGYIYVGPTAASKPTRSTINFSGGDIRANNFVIQVAPDGTIGVVFIGSGGVGSTDVVIDISGYYMASTGAQFHTLDSARILDSRVPVGLAGPIPANSAKSLAVWGHGKVPSGAVGITANLTVTAQTAGGFVAAGPVVSPSTPFSNLNFPSGDIRANGICVPLDKAGNVQLLIGAQAGVNAQLILDVNGYFL